MASKEPTVISGVITKLEGVDFCMDGVTHILHSVIGITRIAGANRTTIKQIGDFADGKTKVMVTGHYIQGAECIHLSVDRLMLVKDLLALMDKA